jgi:hypothetical protein
MVEKFTTDSFVPYFFGNFACVLVDITSNHTEFWKQENTPEFWNSTILGCFYVCHSEALLN